jgi:hypothetical protein
MRDEMPRKIQTRTIFVLWYEDEHYYFCESNMRCVPWRFFAREDRNVPRDKAPAVLAELAAFYGVSIKPGTIVQGPSFSTEETIFLRRSLITIRVISVEAAVDIPQRNEFIVPLKRHPLYPRMQPASYKPLVAAQ